MSYGLEVKNEDDVLQIDETHLNYGFISSGTATCNTFISSVSRLYRATVTVTNGTNPVVAIHTDGNAIALSGIVTSGSTRTYYYLGPQNAEFIYYVFDEYPESTSGYGLQVFNASGDVTFNSNYPPMKVVGFGQFGLAQSETLPSGVYAAVMEKPEWYAFTFEIQYPDGTWPYRSLYTGVSTTSTNVYQLGLTFEAYQSSVEVDIEGTVGSPNILVIDVTGIGTQPSNTPIYSISVNDNSINEGETATFTVNTTNVSQGTTLYWTTTGTVNASDFTDSQTTGSVTIDANGQATITRTASNDGTTEGDEYFEIQLRTTSTSGTIVATSPTVDILDTSLNDWSIIPRITSVNEGSSVIFDVVSDSLVNGTSVYFSTIGTVSAADFTDSTLIGSNTVTNNATTFTRTLANDTATEGAETFQLQLRTGSSTGTLRATSNTVTVNDTSVAPDYTPSVTGTWSNISDTTSGDGDTGNVTLSDINQTINLYWTNGAGDSDNITVQYSVNGGAFTTLAEGSSNTVAITNGQTLGWRVTTTQSTNQTGTITIKNASDSDATVGNTFTYTLAVASSDVTPDAISFGSSVSGGILAGTSTEDVTGINASISISASSSNSSQTVNLYRTGSSTGTGNPLTFVNNDTIQVIISGVSNTYQSGTITVTNVTDSNTTLTTFTAINDDTGGGFGGGGGVDP